MSVDACVRVRLGDFLLDTALSVGDGELLALLGPNAAGKTTLLRALAGLLALDDGHVRIGDRVVDDPHAGVFVPPERRPVGVVFQDYLLFPHLSALDNVAFGLRERGLRRRDARRRAGEWLARVGVGAQQDARPRELSGGQAQRVALARAFVTAPALLLLDEPFAALDAQTRGELRRDLRRILAGFDGARILVTHDPVDALTLADRLMILQDGRVAQSGTPEEIVARPRSRYVAELVGTNLYRGDGSGEVVRLRAGHELRVTGDHHGAVLAIVPPHAVVLHRRPPEGSARNVWQGAVDGIERTGDRVRVRVAVGGGASIVAEVTPAAVTALDLRDGTDVWAAVKATEIEVYPA